TFVRRGRRRVEGAEHSVDERRRLLHAVADLMSAERPMTLALMADPALGAGKTHRQGDPEVSEAIDFCRYYGSVGLDSLVPPPDVADLVEVEAAGTVAVVAPWNFPYAIPTGGVAAAIAAGNRVVLKPAPEAIHIGAWIVDQFHRAGVPDSLLRLAVCDDGDVGRHLVTHPGIDAVVLTGSSETAQRFLEWRPDLRLFAETSGKNALVITAAADLDLAIADLVASAFGHAGQKCSAASLAIVEASVYDDPTFGRRLADAVRSVRVGPADDPATIMGPLIAPPNDRLRRALTRLDPGERWLVQPRQLDERTWTPGVRVGVQPGSWFHRTECFGPMLGVLRADDLDHAIALQNSTDYGLTGGLHSLDDAEIDHWLARVQVGNAYVNRGITGAIVRRQPFGGWKRSAIGGGAKAGGPGHVVQFSRWRPIGHDLDRARSDFVRAWTEEIAADHDPSGLAAESNVLRHLPLERVLVRHDGSDPDSLELLRLAAEVSGVELVESDARSTTDASFVATISSRVGRVRLLGELDDDARRALHRRNIPIDIGPPVAVGTVELRRWVREQSISLTRHRHGRLPDDSQSPAP
ncbi:MAG: aldehyde dehydrogenase family protein, partial [Actinomycetota bacterium]